jgi:hypothetical protein
MVRVRVPRGGPGGRRSPPVLGDIQPIFLTFPVRVLLDPGFNNFILLSINSVWQIYLDCINCIYILQCFALSHPWVAFLFFFHIPFSCLYDRLEQGTFSFARVGSLGQQYPGSSIYRVMKKSFSEGFVIHRTEQAGMHDSSPM